jgi:hypothetical protein
MMDWKYSNPKFSSRSASVQNVQAVQAVQIVGSRILERRLELADHSIAKVKS